MLTESLLLSLFGAGLGLLLAVRGVDMLIGLQPPGVPRLDNVRIDATVAAFTLVLASGTVVLSGPVPALQTTRGPIAGGLKEAGRSALTSRSGSRVRSALVVSEIVALRSEQVKSQAQNPKLQRTPKRQIPSRRPIQFPTGSGVDLGIGLGPGGRECVGIWDFGAWDFVQCLIILRCPLNT